MHRRIGPAALLLVVALVTAMAQPVPLPVRGLHIGAPKPEDVSLAARFIREVLPAEGVNTLVVQFDYRYQFASRPEIVDDNALSAEDVKALAAACRDAGVRLIPQINLFGHQSQGRRTAALLRVHPEFDETPGKYPNNEGIYCRSYCPLHPKVHDVVFDLVDEIVAATGAGAFHAGLDEVFLIADPDCPRCAGKDPADLFAGEVRRIHSHLRQTGVELWMWGDRLLDGMTWDIGKLEASLNGTHPAIGRIPKDIVINDWHYDQAVPSAEYFAKQGFRVVSSPYRKPRVALGQLELIRKGRASGNEGYASRLLGVLQTTWGGAAPFIRACYGKETESRRAIEAARCFKDLFREIRRLGLAPNSSSRPGAGSQ